MASNIVHDTDFESEVYDSEYESEEDEDEDEEMETGEELELGLEAESDMIDFLGIDGEFIELASSVVFDQYRNDIVNEIISDTDAETDADNDESDFEYPLSLNEIQSLSMNQILDILLYQMQ